MSVSELKALAARVMLALEKARDRERAEIVARMSAMTAPLGLSPHEVLFGGDSGKRAERRQRRIPVATGPQFRDPDTGATWSGRGRRPRWLKGEPEKFRVSP